MERWPEDISEWFGDIPPCSCGCAVQHIRQMKASIYSNMAKTMGLAVQRRKINRENTRRVAELDQLSAENTE